jgi:N-acetyl-anhydromuramyl-L-alanine amidase AmpD
MHSVGVFRGLVGHRDLTKNDHADSPNKKDWERILTELKRIQDPTSPES